MSLFQLPVQVAKTQPVKQLDARWANMPSFPVVSEILSFVITSTESFIHRAAAVISPGQSV